MKKIKLVFLLACILMVNCTSTGWIRPDLKDDLEGDEKTQIRNLENQKKELANEKIQTEKIEKSVAISPVEDKNPEALLFKKNDDLPSTKIQNGKYPVQLSGDRFVREVKFHPRVKKETTVITIMGNAQIKYGNMILKAPIFEVLGEKQQLAVAKKGITFEDKKEKIDLIAGFAEYFKNEERLIARNKPQIKWRRIKERDEIKIRSNEIERIFASKMTTAWGNVYVENDEIYLFAQKASLYEKEKKLTAEKEPKIFQKENIISAGFMTYYIDKKKVILTNPVKILFTAPEGAGSEIINTEQNNEGSQNAERGKVTGAIESYEAVYEFSKDIPEKKVILLNSGNNKPVRVENDDFFMTCQKVKAAGEKQERITAQGNIKGYIKKSNLWIFSELADYFREEKKLIIQTVENKDKKEIMPQIDVYSGGNKKNMSLSARIIERIIPEKKIIARGNVQIEYWGELQTGILDDSKSGGENGKVVMGGEWAEMTDDDETVEITGSPFIKSGKNKIYATKIILFSKEKRAEIKGKIHGSLGKE
ncbi:MAG: hypothetical protein OEZ13_07610 [Spirochaetia bacterium]|nr:hypothetical protein [Spirochaetia bacterium]